jgi:hypothetical protein
VKLTFGAPSMIPVVDALARVAKSGATVLLQGESGTGKEVAARLLHETSPRAKAPSIAINCATGSRSSGSVASRVHIELAIRPLVGDVAVDDDLLFHERLLTGRVVLHRSSYRFIFS